MPKYSQVFLKDRKLCEIIASRLRPENFDLAVEIGPGGGALTEFLYPLWGSRLSLVEIDPELAERMRKKYPSARVYNADFMELDLGLTAASLPLPAPDGRVAFIGNLPYECSTAVLLKTLAFPCFGGAVFMFQKEVAEKIIAPAGSRAYGYLSAAARIQSGIKRLADVAAGSFSPKPEVDSSVLEFSPIRAFGSGGEREAFLKFVKSAFSHRRKTLMNSLALGLCMDKSRVKGGIEAAGFDPGTRPQNLTPEDYLKLAEAFGKKEAR